MGVKGNRKRCLGFPSQTAAVLALQDDGYNLRAISEIIQKPVDHVSALLSTAGRGRTKRPAEVHGRTILFPVDLLEDIAHHAERRKISTNELARRIVQIAADDQLIDALLDDAHELTDD